MLLVGPGPDSAGGIWVVIRTMLASPLADEYDLRHIATHRDGSGRDKLQAAAAGILRVGRELALRRVDLLWVHASADFSFRRKTVVVGLARLFRVPCVLHVHGSRVQVWYERTNPAERALVRAVLRTADIVVALMPTWQRRFREWTRCRTAAVANPVEIPPLAADEGREPGRVVTFGRLGERKGSKVLVTAIALLADRGIDASVTLAGDGDREDVEAKAAELGVADRVTVLSWIGPEDVARLLDTASVFALPSRDEGLPIALLEAMAHGVPAVVTPVGGIPDLVTDGQDAVVVRPDDPEGLADAIGGLLADPARARELGLAGRRTVTERCAVPVVADRMSQIFRALLSRH